MYGGFGFVKPFSYINIIIRVMTNNKQETIEEAANRILSKEGVKLHPSGLETYLKGNVINAMVEMIKWFEQVKK
jgi:hypothetical protein